MSEQPFTPTARPLQLEPLTFRYFDVEDESNGNPHQVIVYNGTMLLRDGWNSDTMEVVYRPM